jgi:hypothetical protein
MDQDTKIAYADVVKSPPDFSNLICSTPEMTFESLGKIKGRKRQINEVSLNESSESGGSPANKILHVAIPLVLDDESGDEPEAGYQTPGSGGHRAEEGTGEPIMDPSTVGCEVAPGSGSGKITNKEPNVSTGEREPEAPRSPKNNIAWILITLVSISIKFPKDKLQNISKAFIAHVGAPFVQAISIDNQGRPTFKIRNDKLKSANQFSFQNMDFKVMKFENRNNSNNKLGRGITQIPNTMSFEEFKNKMKIENPDIKEIHQNYEFKNNKRCKTNTVAITFNKEETPLSIKSGKKDELLPIMPAQLSILRCQNCQVFGHNKAKCRNPIKCPHCAGPHGHKSCKNMNLKNCANCFGQHSAAYKGCPTYLKYVDKINQKNIQIKKEHIQKCDQAGSPRILSPQSESIIKTITDQVFGKNKLEIEQILRQHILELDSTIKENTHKSKVSPVQEQKTQKHLKTQEIQAQQPQKHNKTQQQQQNALEQQKTQNKQENKTQYNNTHSRSHYNAKIYPRHLGQSHHQHHMRWHVNGYIPHPHHFYNIRHFNNNYPPLRRF